MNNDDEYVGNGGHLHTGLLDSRLTEKRLRVSLIFRSGATITPQMAVQKVPFGPKMVNLTGN